MGVVSLLMQGSSEVEYLFAVRELMAVELKMHGDVMPYHVALLREATVAEGTLKALILQCRVPLFLRREPFPRESVVTELTGTLLTPASFSRSLF